jgi:hypothetical protein
MKLRTKSGELVKVSRVGGKRPIRVFGIAYRGSFERTGIHNFIYLTRREAQRNMMVLQKWSDFQCQHRIIVLEERKP